MNVNLTDPTPRREGCAPFCAEPYGGDHEPECAQDVALTRDEIDALLEARRVLGEQARAVRPDYLAALDRAVVKLHVGLVQVAMVSVPHREPCALPGCVATHRTTESELRLLDGNR